MYKKHNLPLLQQILRNISEYKLPNLATTRQRNLSIAILSQPKDMHGGLMPTQHFPDPALYVSKIRFRRICLAKQKRHRNFHQAGMRNTNDNRTCDRRVSNKPLFNLKRIYILASYFTHISTSQYIERTKDKNVPLMIISLNRPVIVQYPSTSNTASSPVCNHGSPYSSLKISSAVFSGFSQ